MTDAMYRAFLDLMMCTDPWPEVMSEEEHTDLIKLAEEEAANRNYPDWITAYHGFKVVDEDLLERAFVEKLLDEIATVDGRPVDPVKKRLCKTVIAAMDEAEAHSVERQRIYEQSLVDAKIIAKVTDENKRLRWWRFQRLPRVCTDCRHHTTMMVGDSLDRAEEIKCSTLNRVVDDHAPYGATNKIVPEWCPLWKQYTG